MQPDEIAKLLRDGIREGALMPGQALVQDELAKRFKLSRIPIREALRILEAEGMAESRPGGGLAVTKLTSSLMDELFDLRLTLEPGLGVYIVANASASDLARWHSILGEMRLEENNSRLWAKLNYQFHLTLYGTSQRLQTVKIIRSLMDRTLPYAHLYMKSSSINSALDDEHAQLIESIEQRNPDRFGDVIRSHLSAAQRALVEALEVAEQSAANREWF